MRTKAEILTAKRDFLIEELTLVQREMDGLKLTECGLACASCGDLLATEWDFASHFHIPDERYLNLGHCPTKDNPSRATLPVHFKLTTQIGN